MEAGEIALWLAGWVAAFMLGKELQTGFTRWQEARRAERRDPTPAREAPVRE